MRKALVWTAAAVFPLTILVPTTTARAQAIAASDPGLERALRAAGWQVRRLADAGLEIRHPRSGPPATPPTTASPSGPVRAEAAAWDRLRARGWRVERSEDGSILLFPPGPGGPTIPLVEEVQEQFAAPEARVAAPAQARSDVPASTHPDIGAVLQARGWRAEREDDGSLLVYPLGSNGVIE